MIDRLDWLRWSILKMDLTIRQAMSIEYGHGPKGTANMPISFTQATINIRTKTTQNWPSVRSYNMNMQVY